MKKGRGVDGHVTYVDGGDGLAAVELEVQGRGPRRRGGGAGVQGTRRRGAGDAAASTRRRVREEASTRRPCAGGEAAASTTRR